MPCIPLVNPRRRHLVIGFICGFEPVFDYDGHLFEVHSYFGPIPLRKTDHSPKDPRRIPKAFWAMWERFTKLTTEEKDTYRVE